MPLQLCRRHFGRSLREKLFFLALCSGITMIIIKLESVRRTSSSHSVAQFESLYKNSLKHREFTLNLTRSETEHVTIGHDRKLHVTGNTTIDCPIIDLFTSVDKTAKTYDKDLLCDDNAQKSDIVCRLFFRQMGLEDLARSNCVLETPEQVPKVVYFVIFGNFDFKFVHYIALMAAKRHISPKAIYVIGNQRPVGRWWEQSLRDVHDVRFLYRDIPPMISEKSVKYIHHLSDVVRLQILYMNGGIYLDADMVVVRDLDPLLDFEITLGLVQNGTGIGNAFIAAKRGSTFIREWYTEYTRYKEQLFFWNSLQVPRNMWFKNRSRLHMESDRLYRPNWYEPDLLFKRNDYPWWNNYAVHIWSKHNPVPKSPDDIQSANTTVAQIFRKAMYGDWKPRVKNSSEAIH